MSELPDWEGVPGALEHRTVGSHRAWCFNDGEWCYPESELMCPCCHGVLGHEEMWFDPKVGPPERAILTDLIAELRDQMDYYPPDVFPPFTADDPADQSRTVDRIAGVAMRDAWTRAAAMATCAEQRLREVTGG